MLKQLSGLIMVNLFNIERLLFLMVAKNSFKSAYQSSGFMNKAVYKKELDLE